MGRLVPNLPFKLVKPKKYTIKRFSTGEVVKGVWVKPSPTTMEVDLIIFPHVKRDVLEVLPEGLRKRKTISIFSNVELKETFEDSPHLSDEVTYNNQRYRVFKLASFIDVNGVTAYRAYAVMISNEELELVTDPLPEEPEEEEDVGDDSADGD